MKKNKKVEIFDDIECDVLQIKLTPESDREASEFIKAYKEKMAEEEKKKSAKKQAHVKTTDRVVGFTISGISCISSSFPRFSPPEKTNISFALTKTILYLK
jgi:hypothetical protein